MSLTPWEPFRDWNLLRHQMNRFLDPNWWSYPAHTGAGTGMPRLDVYQTDHEVVAKCELPGLSSQDDVEVTVDDKSLTIRGEMKRGEGLREENYLHSERYYGTFTRSIALPTAVKPEETRATYRDGILSVHMPKAAGERRRTVKVDVQH